MFQIQLQRQISEDLAKLRCYNTQDNTEKEDEQPPSDN